MTSKKLDPIDKKFLGNMVLKFGADKALKLITEYIKGLDKRQ